MREGLFITPSLIRRRYDQGLDSSVRLIGDLKARIEDLSALHIGNPQKQIQSQAQEIKRLEQTIANKDAELVEVYQINKQLERRIRELEKSLETSIALNLLLCPIFLKN